MKHRDMIVSDEWGSVPGRDAKPCPQVDSFAGIWRLTSGHENSLLLRLLDHPHCCSVLDAASWILPFELRENVAARRLTRTAQMNQAGVTDAARERVK